MAINNYRTRLALTVVDASEFTWTRKSDGVVGVADETLLPEHMIGRVWPDAADIGFMVRGKHRTLLFVHVQTLKDAGGELVSQVFQCREFPHIEVHVCND